MACLSRNDFLASISNLKHVYEYIGNNAVYDFQTLVLKGSILGG